MKSAMFVVHRSGEPDVEHVAAQDSFDLVCELQVVASGRLEIGYRLGSVGRGLRGLLSEAGRTQQTSEYDDHKTG
jgi:hypothetical protein